MAKPHAVAPAAHQGIEAAEKALRRFIEATSPESEVVALESAIKAAVEAKYGKVAAEERSTIDFQVLHLETHEGCLAPVRRDLASLSAAERERELTNRSTNAEVTVDQLRRVGEELNAISRRRRPD